MNKEKKCSICEAPYNKVVKGEDGRNHSERITCTGHVGILPYLWNLHPDYQTFEMSEMNAARKRAGLQPLK